MTGPVCGDAADMETCKLIINILQKGSRRHVTKRKEAEDALMKSDHELREANELKDRLFSELEAEKEKSDKLLLNILPTTIAERLKSGEETIADHFDEASIVFADIVEFTQISAGAAPERIVQVLDDIFTKFDKISEKYGLEKIKTIGDCYMAVAGVPEPNLNHAEAAANWALEVMEMMKDYKFKHHESSDNSNGDIPIKFRIGMHCGPVVAGVIGKKKFIYDLWGDTVNTASRMEENGVSGMIHVSNRFKETLSNTKTFQDRGEIVIKGKGTMRTWFLTIDEKNN